MSGSRLQFALGLGFTSVAPGLELRGMVVLVQPGCHLPAAIAFMLFF
jgi:hypothetical protein